MHFMKVHKLQYLQTIVTIFFTKSLEPLESRWMVRNTLTQHKTTIINYTVIRNLNATIRKHHKIPVKTYSKNHQPY